MLSILDADRFMYFCVYYLSECKHRQTHILYAKWSDKQKIFILLYPFFLHYSTGRLARTVSLSMFFLPRLMNITTFWLEMHFHCTTTVNLRSEFFFCSSSHTSAGFQPFFHLCWTSRFSKRDQFDADIQHRNGGKFVWPSRFWILFLSFSLIYVFVYFNFLPSMYFL